MGYTYLIMRYVFIISPVSGMVYHNEMEPEFSKLPWVLQFKAT